MKKILCAFAVMTVLAFTAGVMSSCEEVETGTYFFHVSVTFNDNLDLLTTAIDEGFKEAGFTQNPNNRHYWSLTGEKKASVNKGITTFQNRCKAIDKNRSLIAEASGFGSTLAIKGEKAKLILGLEPGSEEVSEYTFVENDAE